MISPALENHLNYRSSSQFSARTSLRILVNHDKRTLFETKTQRERHENFTATIERCWPFGRISRVKVSLDLIAIHDSAVDSA